MKTKIQSVLRNSFYQLLLIYILIIILIVFGFLSKYSLQFNLLALIIGIIGGLTLSQSQDIHINKKIHYALLIIGILLIIFIRILPYFNTSIPLGYDPGIYKYGIEDGLKNQDKWILSGGMEPGFLYLMELFKPFFSTDFILTYLFIFFCVLLGIAIYFLTREYFESKTTALLAVFIYAFSIVQFKTFWYLYYKNVIGLILALFSIYFLEKYKKNNKRINLLLFVILGGLIGAIHRPTFYIYGISYFFYAFISPYSKEGYNKKSLLKNIIYGMAILIIFFIFYIGKFMPAITTILPWVANGFIDPGQSPGTFIDFTTYQFSILPYFLFAILGLVFCLRKKLGFLEIWAVINLLIVFCQFFFFNRFIIMLDIVLIIFAAKGFNLILENKKKLGIILILILITSMGFLALHEARTSQPLIDKTELSAMEHLSQTPKNSFAMSTSSHYSPWIIGYSERKTIAPGLFDYDLHNKENWINFWASSNLNETKQFLNEYEKPLYIFIGKRQNDNLAQFIDSECFELSYSEQGNKIYNYLC